MDEKGFELEAGAKLENLPAMIDFVIGSLKKLGVDDHSTFDIQLAVDEISANVIRYAYKDKPGRIWLACRRDANAILITIRDEGYPFDPTRVPPPDLDADLAHRKPGGLGIYLAKQVMDTVSYKHEAGRNVLTMKKFIK
jgi:anti-sigma regulatory factor (Ser/Thr protein kinase)